MTMNKNMKKIIGVSTLVLIGLVAVGLRFHNEEKIATELTPSDQKPASMGLSNSLVQIEEIKRQDVQDSVQMTGKLAIDSLRLQQISARVPGRVDRLAMVEGQPVRSGQVLAWVYSPEFISA
jgi:multidrug efflux pump subunit AcrA (membrane-fusion protein)